MKRARTNLLFKFGRIQTTDWQVHLEMSTAAATEVKPAPPAIEKDQGQGGRARNRSAEALAGSHRQARAHDDDSGDRSREDGCAALLLSSEAAHRRQLPHVPRRVRHARARARSQAGDEPDGTPKIAKSPRPAIACATPISPGMEIYTKTPSVKQMREGVLESLLINHPLDCPICDQAGECKLQEYSVDYGQSASRFVEAKVHKPKAVDLGPRIMLDAERCILCTRCIRFTRDVAGDDALGIVNRGSYNTIATYPGMPFNNNYTLNTVDICPVGALTSKDFRFQMRVVSQGRPRASARVARRAATSSSARARKRFTATRRATTTASTVRGCATPAA